MGYRSQSDRVVSRQQQERLTALLDSIKQPEPEQPQPQSNPRPQSGDNVPGRMWSSFDSPWNRHR